MLFMLSIFSITDISIIMVVFNEIDPNDFKELGKSGERVPAIGIGTWDIRNRRNMVEALVHAVNLGLNVIDTAEMYGGGNAERIVGDAIKIVGRENVFITTKLMPDKFVSEDAALRAMRGSLERLGVKEVDLILIHWYSPNTPVSRMVKALEAIVDKGYTRYIGVSNFGKNLLEESLNCLSRYEIVVNQVKYSVLDKYVERELLPFMVREGITVQAYTPLERGGVVKNRVLMKMSGKYGKSAVQIALNYLICHRLVTTIPKTEKVGRVDEFHGALGWRLDEEDFLELKGL